MIVKMGFLAELLWGGVMVAAILLVALDKRRHRLVAPLSEWRPIDTVPNTGQVVLFCDPLGNRWTGCAYDWNEPVCGMPASSWVPLPPPPSAKECG